MSRRSRWRTRSGTGEIESHALNNVGTALSIAGRWREGYAQLTESLDIALAIDAHEHAARAYTNLGSECVDRHLFTEADRLLKAGIDY